MARIIKCKHESCKKEHDFKSKEKLHMIENVQKGGKGAGKITRMYYCNEECYANALADKPIVYVRCKCKSCNKNNNRDDIENLYIVKILAGLKNRNLYYCNEKCYLNSVKEDEFIEFEEAEKDKLNEVVKSIYGVAVGLNLTNRWWTIIGDLRNGTNRYEKLWKRRYKKGVPYAVIAEAYRISKDSIHWAKLNKNFKTFEQELRYGLSIIASKVIDADRKIKRSAIQEKASNAMEGSRIDIMEDNREVVFKKVEDENDLSFLLGDD